MKYYKCKICKYESGSRKKIRDHAKKEHGKKREYTEKGTRSLPSDISLSYTSHEIK